MNSDDHSPVDAISNWRVWVGDRLHAWQLALGVALCGLFLWLAFRGVPLDQITGALGGLKWGWVLLGLVLSILSTLARGARWRLLCYPNHGQQDFIRLTGILFISQMLNLLVPFRAGELARIYLMREFSTARTLGSIAVEKVLDMLTLLAFLLVLPLLVGVPEWFREPSQAFILLALGLFGLSLLLYFSRNKLVNWLLNLIRFLPAKWQDRFQNFLVQAMTSLDVFASPGIGVRLMSWSLVIWGLGAAINGMLMRAMGLNLPLAAPLFLLLVLQVGISVPSVPGKLGVFQYLVILALAPFGVGKGVALTYSLVLYLVAFSPHLVFGTLFGIRETMIDRQLRKPPGD